jgi:hypothetical protein
MSNKSVNTYQYGNTIRFECKFYDFNEQLVDPELVKIVIYNYKYEIVHDEILGINNKRTVGDYFHDYTTELKAQKYYYEWYGEINGKPSLKRGEFMTKFI